ELSNGDILAAGSVAFAGSGYLLARFHADGALDTGFGTNGSTRTNISQGNEALAMAALADRRIVLGGYTYNGGGTYFSMARYTADGSLDNSFGTGGRILDLDSGSFIGNGIHGIAVQPDGKYVVAGEESLNGGNFEVARYNTDGTVDPTFGTGGRL